MSLKTITQIIFLAVCFLLIVWDLIAFYRGGTKATESNFVWTLAKRFPSIPFCFGVIMGHFFFTQ